MSDSKKLPEKTCFPYNWLSLPSTWDASTSQLEMLQSMLYNINSIINYLEDLQTNYEDYTDNAIAVLKAWTQSEIDNLKSYHDKTLADLKQYVDTQDEYYWTLHLKDIADINNSISSLRNYVDTNFKDIRDKHTADINKLYADLDMLERSLIQYIDNNNEYIKTWVQDELNKILDLVDEINEDGFRIYNPITGEKDHVEDTVLDVYEALRYGACTALQFDNWFIAFNKTGEDFKNLNMTALQYDVSGYDIMYHDLIDRCNSPASGKIVDTCTAVGDAGMMGNPWVLSAQERDSLELTGEDYITLNKDALWWDTMSLTINDNQNAFMMSRNSDGTFTKGFVIDETTLTKEIVEDEAVYYTWVVPSELGFNLNSVNIITNYNMHPYYTGEQENVTILSLGNRTVYNNGLNQIIYGFSTDAVDKENVSTELRLIIKTPDFKYSLV